MSTGASFDQPHPFAPIQTTCWSQTSELYGMPNISARQLRPLAEAATPFRRKYYQNGAHAGYIMA